MKKILISMLAVFMLMSCTGLNVSVPVNIATDTAFVLILQNNPTYKPVVIAALTEIKAILNGSLTYDDLIIAISKKFAGKYAVVAVILQGYLDTDKPISTSWIPMLDSYKVAVAAKVDRLILLASI